MRSADGQNIVERQLTTPPRVSEKSRAGSKAGKFLAYGVAPATFVPMPKPRRISQPPVEATAKFKGRDKRTSEERAKVREAGLRRVTENNARQAEYSRQLKEAKKAGFVAPAPRGPSRWNGIKKLRELIAREYEENGFPLHVIAKLEAEGRL